MIKKNMYTKRYTNFSIFATQIESLASEKLCCYINTVKKLTLLKMDMKSMYQVINEWLCAINESK